MAPTSDCPTMVRLRAAADRIAQLEAELIAERERHRELVADTRDDGCGHSWVNIGKAARRAPSRCHAMAAEN